MSPAEPKKVAGWVIKGVRSRMNEDDWAMWLVPGEAGHWYTGKKVHPVVKGTPVFFFKGAPDSVLVGEGLLTGTVDDDDGQTLIGVEVVRPFTAPLHQADLRADPAMAEASFLKVGPVGTFYPLTSAQVERIRELAGEREDESELKPAPDAGDLWQPGSDEDARERVERSIALRRGQQEFRDALLAAYGGRCALTGCDAVDALEAAHIAPYNGADSNHVQNGLLLCADLHTLFDLGLLRLDPNTLTVALTAQLKGTTYEELQGRTLNLPTSQELHPSREALRRRWGASAPR